VLGSLALLLVLRAAGGAPRPRGRATAELLVAGMVGFGVSLGAQFVGTALSSAANGALVTSASPAFLVLFAAWLLGERLTALRLAALGLATAGAVAVTLGGGAEAPGADPASVLPGNIALLVAAVTWGLYSVLAKRLARSQPVLVVTLYAFLGGLLVAVPATVIELAARGRPPGPIDEFIVAGVLYLGLISTAGAMWLWNKGLQLLDAGLVSLFFFAQPAVGALLGWLLLHERLTAWFFAGAALIAAGVLLVSLFDAGRRPAPAQEVSP
jgi:drug/metabolite transporter (DMT)-like permease